MEDEVLVHISTPATRQNDELFRSLADAYTAFRPHRVHRDDSGRKERRKRKAIRRDQSTRTDYSVIQGVVDPTVLTASIESYGSFPSDLTSDEHCHACGPASVNDDSTGSISRLAQLDRSYLSWRKRVTPRMSFTRGQQEPPNSSSGPEDADTGFIEDSQSALEALQSQLQDTYSTASEDASENEECQYDSPSDNQQSSHKLSPGRSQPKRTEEGGRSPTAAEDNIPTDKGGSLLEVITDLSTYATRTRTSTDTIVDQLDFSTLPVDAFPPAPAISVARPGALPSQITKHLAAIQTKNPNRFKPLRVRRLLNADERGYWRVDCVQWPSEIQRDFWSSLYEHVCSGRVGWGTTLHRESDSGHSLGHVRLYCWGEVVEHMWLLMWLCSKGSISTSESCWIDANNVAVVEV